MSLEQRLRDELNPSELVVVKTQYGWSNSMRPISWFVERCFDKSVVKFDRICVDGIDCLCFVVGLLKNAPLCNIVIKEYGEPEIIFGHLMLSVIEAGLKSDNFSKLKFADRRFILELRMPVILIQH